MKMTNNKTSVSRRNFLGMSSSAIVGLSILGISACNRKPESYLTVIAYNVLKFTGWPAENMPDKLQMPKLMAEELAKYSPDIINFSESPDKSLVRTVAELLKMNYAFFPSGGNWPGAVLTRFEIVGYENVPLIDKPRPEDLFTRHWGRVVIELPDKEHISVHSVHLYPHDNPVSAEIRQREIAEILKSMESDLKSNKSILVIGDLNHTPAMPEYNQWMNAGLKDTYAVSGIGDGLTIRADTPSKRIDFILAAGPVAEQIIESKALFEGAFRTNPDDPESYALSDHLPQYAKFKF